VIVADDHTLLAEAFARLLTPQCDVISVVGDGRAAIADAVRFEPDVIVLDVAMPLLNGLDVARFVRQQLPRTRVVFVTMSEDPDLAAEALRIGASAFLLKSSAASELLTAIRAVLNGDSYVTPRVAEAFEDNGLIAHDHAGPALTARQLEVLRLLAQGRSMKQVAAALQITPRAVAFHKYCMMEQLRIRSTAELIQYAVKKRLVTASGDTVPARGIS
jgi:DNA-binding NarL/FixJ family response regulator